MSKTVFDTKKMQKKQRNILIGVIILLVLVVVAVVLWPSFDSKNKKYSVVYTTTGEIYVGKLFTFPCLRLADPYIYQVAKDATDQNKTNFQLLPMKEALWATDVMKLTRKNVVFYGELNDDSKIAETLATQAKD